MLKQIAMKIDYAIFKIANFFVKSRARMLLIYLFMIPLLLGYIIGARHFGLGFIEKFLSSLPDYQRFMIDVFFIVIVWFCFLVFMRMWRLTMESKLVNDR